MPKVKFEKSDLPNCRETSRDEFLAKFLTDESLTDFMLEGTDGIRIAANRCILSARSDIFQKMLLGGFSEATKKVVKVGFTGRVIKAIVEYILTDTSKELLSQDIKAKNSEEATMDDVKSIRCLVELTGAALYFNLPRLCELAFDALSLCLENIPSLSFVALEAYRREASSVPSVEALVMSFISSTKTNSVNENAVALLGPSVLEEILKTSQIKMDDFQLFEILRLWANAESNEGDLGDLDESLDRKSIASDMIKHIHLEWIDPRILSTSVAESGLVSSEQLLEAFKRQAFIAQEKDHRIFKRPRCLPVWQESGTETTRQSSEKIFYIGDLLKYPPMKSGVHQWVLEVLHEPNNCRICWLGVALATKKFDLGPRPKAWMISCKGTANTGIHSWRHGSSPRNPKGSRVTSRFTFTLNLLPGGEGNGTLSVAIGDQESTTTFSDMRKALGEEDPGGFVPAVSLLAGEGIRLIGIVKLRN